MGNLKHPIATVCFNKQDDTQGKGASSDRS